MLFNLKQVELVQNLINGVHTLIKMEKLLENEETIDGLIKLAEPYTRIPSCEAIQQSNLLAQVRCSKSFIIHSYKYSSI